MIFRKTKLEGAYVIELAPIKDERGYFARSFCQVEFKENGLSPYVAQCNISYNSKKGTLRGMHYQMPREEDKLVSCIRGAIYDIIIDLRRDSLTYCQWLGVQLTAENHLMLYVPKGFAHGYQTLEDKTTVSYQVSEFYSPESERGVRWDDKCFGIKLPIGKPIVSPKDCKFPDFVR